MNEKSMKEARRLKRLSKSRLLKVGAVLRCDGNKTVFGYNGQGYEGDLEDKLIDGLLISKPAVIHAEECVIGEAAKMGWATENSTLFVTTAPCFRCARLIIAAGIHRVVYHDTWWDAEALVYLVDRGVVVERLKK